MSWTWNIPEKFNIGASCIAPSEDQRFSQKDAIIIDDADNGVNRLTYQDLAKQVRKMGARLEQITDQGDRVLIQLPNCLAYPVSFLGVLYAGRVAVPASIMLTIEELIYLLNDSEATVSVLPAKHIEDLALLFSACPRLTQVLLVGDFTEPPPSLAVIAGRSVSLWDTELEQGNEDYSGFSTSAEDSAYLVYTSGTTGYPKGLLHAHRALLGRMPASHFWFHFKGDDDRILHSGKFNWTYVLGTALMDPLYQGKTVILSEGNTAPERWVELIAKHKCSIFIGVPTLYRQILQKTNANQDWTPTLRYCMSAGEHLSDEVLNHWKARFGLNIYEAVGMSECSYYLSQHANKPVKPGAAGFPQPGHRIALLDENFYPVRIGEEGMICISETDPGLFLEYWKLPEETAKTRKNGYFMTGDYARIDDEGYWWFLGRHDDLINSFGYRVSPVEVERVLKGHPSVADCAVVGETIEAEKVLITACVILHDGETLTQPELIDWASAHLAKYKLPKVVRFMEAFPRTRNGKVLRRALLEH